MWNAGVDESQAGIKIARRNNSNLRYANDTTLMAESEDEIMTLLMKVKEQSEKAGLKLNIQKTKIMASGPITSWQIDGETVETVADFILGGSKITANGECSHEIQRCLLLERKAMTNIDSILKSRDITLPTKVHLISSVQFSSVTQSCPSLCHPMDHSMPGLPVHHQLPEFTQTHVHIVSDAIQPSHPLLSPSPTFNLSRYQGKHQGLFSNESVLRMRRPKYWNSASTLVLPMNTQDWSALGWTGWISLKFKGLSRVFSNTTVQNHQFFSTQLSL